MPITNTSLTTTAANVFASSGNNVISSAYFCNDDTVARTVWIYLVPAGATLMANTHTIYKSVTIAAGDTFVMDREKLVFANNETLQANASANSAIIATVNSVGI